MSAETCRKCGGSVGHYASCPGTAKRQQEIAAGADRLGLGAPIADLVAAQQARTVADPINPPYYSANGIEAGDVVDAFGLGFWDGNALKYILRAGKKGPAAVDYRKAIKCLERAAKKAEAGK